ncbi:hypothetical protein MP638_001196, partial [Amoeboaphelidium occidentale]
REDDEISFKKNERILVIAQDEGFDDGWWKGENEMGEIGLFPANFTTTTEPARLSRVAESFGTAGTKEAISISEVVPEEWTVEQVGQWLHTVGFGEFEVAFKEHKMDGAALTSAFLDLAALKELGMNELKSRLEFMECLRSLKHETFRARCHSEPAFDEDFGVEQIRPQAFSFALPKLSLGIGLKNFKLKSLSLAEGTRKDTVHLSTNVPSDVTSLADVMLMPEREGQLRTWSCDFEGFLWKRGGKAHWSWKRRYFILKQMTLWYFKDNRQTSTPLGLITLPSYKIVPSKDCNINGGIFEFQAEHPDARTYYFKAGSLDDMQNWMNAMTKASLGITTQTA